MKQYIYLWILHNGTRDNDSESGEHLFASEALVGIQHQEASDNFLGSLIHHLLSSDAIEKQAEDFLYTQY